MQGDLETFHRAPVATPLVADRTEPDREPVEGPVAVQLERLGVLSETHRYLGIHHSRRIGKPPQFAALPSSGTARITSLMRSAPVHVHARCPHDGTERGCRC